MDDEGVACFDTLAMILLMLGFDSLNFPHKSLPFGELIAFSRVPGTYTGGGISISTPILRMFAFVSGPELLRKNETLLFAF